MFNRHVSFKFTFAAGLIFAQGTANVTLFLCFMLYVNVSLRGDVFKHFSTMITSFLCFIFLLSDQFLYHLVLLPLFDHVHTTQYAF